MSISPLQIPLILKQIFDHCSNTLETVKTHRLVCRAWYEACAFRWNILAPIKLVQNPQYGDLDLGTTSVCQYLDDEEIVETREKFMHQNFTLKWWNIEDDHLEATAEGGHASLNRLFWNTCCQNITTLTLSNCIIPFTFTLIPPAFWRAVPNLENLSLINCTTRKHFINEQIEVTKNELLKARIQVSSMRSHLKLNTLNDLERWTLQVRVSETLVVIVKLQNQLHELKRQQLAMFDDTMAQRVRPPSAMRGIAGITLAFSSFRIVNPEILKQLRTDAEKLKSYPVKLRRLYVRNLTSRESCVPIEWTQIMDIFPKLERIKVSQQEIQEIEAARVIANRKLKQLDVMDISSFRDWMPNESILRLPTTGLSFDCGFETELPDVRTILQRHVYGLEKLSLSRFPIFEPYTRFPCDFLMSDLTKLHLWGNVSENLNFLKLTVGLKQLSWNTSCYDETTHGTLFRSMLGMKGKILFAEHIIKMTDQLDEKFLLESLETLDLDGGALGVTSLKKLGRWLPNLKAFGATVVQKAELNTILEQWPKLVCLELKHGSCVTAEDLINAYVNLGTLQKLKRFTWKSCPCFERTLGVAEICAEAFLRRSCGHSVDHPWKTIPQQQEGQEIRRNVGCLHDLFEKAVTGAKESVDMYRSALETVRDGV